MANNYRNNYYGYLPYAIMFLATSCTYNISMAHTEGSASDVIDDTQSNTPNVSPNLTIPVSALPKV